MDKILAQKLQLVVEAYASGKTEEADAAIHEYICRKSQLMLIGEAEEEKDDEGADDKSDDKKDEDEKDEDKSDDKKDEDEKDEDEKE